MMRSLSGFSRASLLHRKGRSFLTGAGIALGVALFFGSLIASASGLGAMDHAIEQAAGRVDVVITPVGDMRQAVISGAIGDRVAGLPDVASVAGVVVVPTTISTLQGRSLKTTFDRPNPAVLVGADPEHVGRLYTFGFSSGRQVDPRSDEIVVTDRISNELSLDVGDRATVATPTGNRRVVVSGILDDSGAARYNQGNVIFTSLGWARETSEITGAVSQILIDLDDGVDVDRWLRSHGSSLGRGMNVQSFGDASMEAIARGQLTAAGAVLNVLSATIMFIAGFLIYLTLSTAVVERVRMYGVLRALGARRDQVRRLVVTEALMLGSVATIAGLVLGLGVAAGFIAVSRSFLFELEASAFIVPPWAAFAAAGLGILTTLVSAFLPARRAARLDPVEAMRGDFATHLRLSRTWIVGSVALMIGAFLLLRANNVVYLGVAAPLLLFGAVAVVPLLLRPIARATGTLTSRLARGVGAIAVLHLSRERTRSGYTLALVMIVMASVIAISATNDSFSRSLDQQMIREFRADLRLESTSTFPSGFERELAGVDGVAQISSMAAAMTRIVQRDGSEESAMARIFDPESHFRINDLVWREGNASIAKRALARGRELILMHPTAKRLGVGVGDDLVLRTSKGDRSFRIAATADMSNNLPEVNLSWRDGEQFFGIRRPSVFMVSVTEGANLDEVRETIEEDLGSRATLMVSTLDDARAFVQGIINSGLNAFVVLLLMAGILGLFGLTNTMAVSMLERYREIGLLRAIGARKRQVRSMALVESSTLVAVAFVLALPLGSFLAFTLVRFSTHLVGDVTIHFSFPWRMLPLLVVGGTIAAAVTAIGPARRATQLDIETSLRFE